MLNKDLENLPLNLLDWNISQNNITWAECIHQEGLSWADLQPGNSGMIPGKWDPTADSAVRPGHSNRVFPPLATLTTYTRTRCKKAQLRKEVKVPSESTCTKEHLFLEHKNTLPFFSNLK